MLFVALPILRDDGDSGSVGGTRGRKGRGGAGSTAEDEDDGVERISSCDRASAATLPHTVAPSGSIWAVGFAG